MKALLTVKALSDAIEHCEANGYTELYIYELGTKVFATHISPSICLDSDIHPMYHEPFEGADAPLSLLRSVHNHLLLHNYSSVTVELTSASKRLTYHN